MPKMKERMTEAALNDKGQELLDPVPMAPPIGYRREESLHDKIRSMVRGEHLRLAALEAGAETFAEADDFEVGDDFDPRTEYEEVFDPVDAEARMRLRDDDFRASVEARSQQLRPATEVDDGNEVGRADAARNGDRSRRSGQSDKVGKGKPVSKSDDGSSVRGAVESAAGVKAED